MTDAPQNPLKDPTKDLGETRQTAEKNVTLAGNVLNVMSMSWPGQMFTGMVGAADSAGKAANWVANGFSSAPAGMVETSVGAVGGWVPLLVGAGPAIHAVSDTFQGHFKDAAASVAKGAAMVGTVAIETGMMSLAFPAEVASLIFTGKFLTTHIGDMVQSEVANIVGSEEKDAANPPANGNLPAFGIPLHQQVVPPTLRYAAVPGQAVPMQAIPQTGRAMPFLDASPGRAQPWTTQMQSEGHGPRQQRSFTAAELARQQSAGQNYGISPTV